ncbi:hypothetical protein JOD97_001230 [Duganella sp. 1411]|jgi:hypothetical protein|uniref:DUF3460 family protein n=1 Tax=Duganella sp. 1411 TaxID=2806572 RepID=UPI001AE94BA6|nr:DUF3460 family protein [Duganella sp. 1411]MBP1203216.1 hypothetical protein [Duganella sp. 1411]
MKFKYLYGPGRKEYVSEFGRFLDGYLRAHPEVRRDQELGWRIWWERPVDPRAIDRERQAELKPAAYHSYYYE